VFLMYHHRRGGPGTTTTRLVDEDGAPDRIFPFDQDALEWLVAAGQAQVGIPVEGEVRVFSVDRLLSMQLGADAIAVRMSAEQKARGAALRRRLGRARWRAVRRSMVDPTGRLSDFG